MPEWRGIAYSVRRRALDMYLRRLYQELTTPAGETLGVNTLDPGRWGRSKAFGTVVAELIGLYSSLVRRGMPLAPWPDADEARLLRRLQELDAAMLAEVDLDVQRENRLELERNVQKLRKEPEVGILGDQ